MTIYVFGAVVFAALLHAAWNAALKAQSDKLVAMSAIVFGGAFWGLISLIFAPLPHADSYGYMLWGAALHIGYNIFLQAAYRYGDFSLVYPISRGVAPLFVTLFSIFVLGIEFENIVLIGLIAIILGVICLAFAKNHMGKIEPKAVGLALITACFIASYSLVDGFGARLSGNVLGYYAVLSLLGTAGYSVFIGFYRPSIFMTLIKHHKKITVLSGGASYLAFSIIMWCFTQAPIALVTGLRESSILFAMLIGLLFFKDRFGKMKFAATIAILTGMVLLRL